jgi:serine/threonine-protein phosphatase PGAM5
LSRFLYLARHGNAVDEGDLSAAGREQARLLGQRMAGVPLTALHHGPLPRAAQTAALVSACLPGVPVFSSEVVGDYFPPVPDVLPKPYAEFLADVTPQEFETGARLAAAAIEQHATATEQESHELIVTHSFLVAWFVRHALDAPEARWVGLNAANCALTVIRYRADRPPALITFNDMTHLPESLRWTS